MGKQQHARLVRQIYNEITARALVQLKTGCADPDDLADLEREFYSPSGHDARGTQAAALAAAGSTEVRVQSKSTTRENHMNTSTQQHAESPEQVEARCRNTWDHNEAIRAEFGDSATYLAYEKASAAGRVKILGGNVRRA